MKKRLTFALIPLLLPQCISAAAPSDVVSSDTCRDAAVLELVHAGYRIECFNAVDGVITNGVCRSDGVCANPKPEGESIPKWKMVREVLAQRAKEMNRWVGDAITSVVYTAPISRAPFSELRPFGKTTVMQVKEETCEQESRGWWLFNLLPSLSAPSCKDVQGVAVNTKAPQKKAALVQAEPTNAELSFYAFPESVRLQGRSTLVWVAEHVTEGSCVVTGPGFRANGDSGQGSTIALNEPTEFIFSCVDLLGEDVFASVVVDIGL